MKQPAVYILASRYRGTLYVGVTNDLARRISEHRDGKIPGFTVTYGVKRLVWYDVFSTVDEAIAHLHEYAVKQFGLRLARGQPRGSKLSRVDRALGGQTGSRLSGLSPRCA